MSHAWNAAIAAGSLGAADYLTGNVASSKLAEWITYLGDHIAGQVSNITTWAAANSNTPILWAASDIVTAGTGVLWAYKGIQATKRDGIIQWIKEGSLWYSLPAGVMVALGLTSAAPWALTAAGIWLWIHGLQQTHKLWKTFMEKPGENLWYGATQPFKWWAWVLKTLFKGKWTPPTP